MKPSAASMVTLPWMSSDSLHLLTSLIGLLLDPALPKKFKGSKMLGNGWVMPGNVLASAEHRKRVSKADPS